MGSNISTSSLSNPMQGGDGSNSYTKYSYLQREGINSAKATIDEAIAEKLDIKPLSSTSDRPFCIADLGCSVGPNTFIAVQNIIDAVELKYRSVGLGSKIPEFQVFFNDHESNDFNTLFTSLPPERRYFATGVPGSFNGRLFPEASLHFMHSSFAVIPWLSKVPKEVVDKNSPAWNKGKIHYLGASNEVFEAYSTQFAKDMEIFLQARAQELVCEGLMVLVMPGHPNESPHSQSDPAGMLFDILGSTLMDMAKMGLFTEAQVESFNLPLYIPSSQELEELIKKNGCFSTEKLELVSPDISEQANLIFFALHMKAAMEGILSAHFGSEVIDELFGRFSRKLAESTHTITFRPDQRKQLVVVLKRK